jgi:cobalt-zinc-cadmium efflux system membrane fusion protein
VSVFSVEHPEQFPLATSKAQSSTPELVVTGSVNPDISRNVPVISLASGRVVAIHARLGDTVKKGQLLLTVRSDDISGAFGTYRKAQADEVLSRTQLDRAKDLYGHGAIALNDLQVAQDTEDKARVDVETMGEHLRLLGNEPDRPNSMVDILAPVSGVITDQQVTNAAGVQSLSTIPFTISDLSTVWIVCDVYENDLPGVRIGDTAEIRLNAYPDHALNGTVSNIGAILDPSIRTAKVRIEMANPGTMRLGMFAKATFRSRTKEVYMVVPASAILHLHDRDWVYVPAPDKKFRRVEVVSGDPLPDNLQQIKSGIKADQQVVANAVVLEHVIAISQ